ncbi:glutaredoxin family protein [Propioniciclava sinopodophylli]|uniref:glutaredoxin family protein n=1 Tax=Propioniciclava sinopodophylli TaxID=1837344 RepID=UPI00249304B4|nr:glutaredoxin family protein [Propioniciclava sinopodophylli]
MTMPDADPNGLTTITIVTAPGCHFCTSAQDAVNRLVAEGAAVRLATVDIHSDAGLRLVAHHRPAMNPLVLVNDQYFSAGRLPERKLRATLRLLDAQRLERAGLG